MPPADVQIPFPWLVAAANTEGIDSELLAKAKGGKMFIGYKNYGFATLVLTICFKCAKMIAEVEFLWV